MAKLQTKILIILLTNGLNSMTAYNYWTSFPKISWTQPLNLLNCMKCNVSLEAIFYLLYLSRWFSKTFDLYALQIWFKWSDEIIEMHFQNWMNLNWWLKNIKQELCIYTYNEIKLKRYMLQMEICISKISINKFILLDNKLSHLKNLLKQKSWAPTHFKLKIKVFFDIFFVYLQNSLHLV